MRGKGCQKVGYVQLRDDSFWFDPVEDPSQRQQLDLNALRYDVGLENGDRQSVRWQVLQEFPCRDV